MGEPSVSMRLRPSSVRQLWQRMGADTGCESTANLEWASAGGPQIGEPKRPRRNRSGHVRGTALAPVSEQARIWRQPERQDKLIPTVDGCRREALWQSTDDGGLAFFERIDTEPRESAQADRGDEERQPESAESDEKKRRQKTDGLLGRQFRGLEGIAKEESASTARLLASDRVGGERALPHTERIPPKKNYLNM